jgi:membrane fusion protein, multidrug efflux system
MPKVSLIPSKFIALLCLALSGLLGGCAEKQVEANKQPAAPITVAQVVAKTVPVEITAVGSVEAYSNITVKTMVAGELQKVHFTEGQDVAKGDLLFTIDERPFRTALEQAEANLARDKAMLLQLEANLARDIAQSEYAQAQSRRYAKLVGEGVISAEQSEQFDTEAKARQEAVAADRAGLTTAQASIQADEAAVRSARVQLSFCSIVSPIDGRTGSLLVHEGNIVKANETVLLSINQVTPAYVSFSVPEMYLPQIRRSLAKGALAVEARIRSNNFGKPVIGNLSFIDNLVDNSTGTIRLKGTFPNTDRVLWPGEFVDTTLRVAEDTNVPVAPTRAVQTGQEGQYVFVLKPDQTVEMRPVVTGQTIGQETVIQKGLQPGETVVTDGQLRLVNGAAVEVKQEAAAATAMETKAE